MCERVERGGGRGEEGAGGLTCSVKIFVLPVTWMDDVTECDSQVAERISLVQN